MKTLTFILPFIMLMTLSVTAQKKTFTLDDVISGGKNYSQLKPHSLNSLCWANDDNFSYVKKDSAIVLQNIAGKEVPVISFVDFKELAFEYSGEHFPSHTWHDDLIIEFSLPQQCLFYDTKNKTSWSIKYPQNASNLDFNYASKRLAYTIENNLYYADKENKEIAISKEDNKDVVYGQSVHRNEFGIQKGTFWSPDGNKLAFYCKDESMVEDYPLVNILTREAQTENIKYPMAGMKTHHVTVGVKDLNSGETVYLKTGAPKDRYFTNISWAPNSDKIYIAEVNRGQDTMNLVCYNAIDGTMEATLFTETDEQYIEPQHPLAFLPNDPTRFLWQTRRDGYNHIYLYSVSGTLLDQITSGKWEVTKFLGFNKDASKILITSTEKSYLERHTSVINIATKERWTLTVNKGVHNSKLSKNGGYILDTWSSVEIPLVTDLINVENSRFKNITTANDPYQGYKLGKTKLFTIPSVDSTLELSCRMILPPNFDKNKTYPTIVYVYGGPHSQLISERWKGGAQMWQHYMAQKGYIMFTLDNRGTSYRGADFEQIIHRQLGEKEMEDQMAGYSYLQSLSYVDNDRIGVFGWSFGGFMTTSLMTHYPDAFKVGVAGGPVIDWSNYEIMYGERYMNTPGENPKGYRNSNVSNYAKDLKGRLLMIHGAQDPVVVWQHSQKFVRQCVIDGVQLDYFVYPTHQHNVRGKDRVHLMEKITRHFDDFL